MNESPVINKDIVTDHSLDLLALKQQGVTKLQELSGNTWTDYNLHDPGITILETLCYALADLSYRAGFEIQDVLYTPANRKIGNSLFPPHEIFTTSPLSLLDFKGLILDVEGVKNCELVPSANSIVIPGSFDVHLEIHPDFDEESTRENIRSAIFKVLEANRPVGIIFDQIFFLEFDPVGLQIDIELTEDVDANKVFSSIITEIQNYLSPEVKFRSLEELIEKQVPIEKIFTGPLLTSGFLLEEEVRMHELRKKIYASDLIGWLNQLSGVKYVKDLKIIGSDDLEYNWIYTVSDGKVPRIDPNRSKFTCRYKNMIVFESKSKSIELFNVTKFNHRSSHTQNKITEKNGVDRNLNKYYSIQNDFPANYGIGDKGPAAGASLEKLAAIKQLKGYLMVFDQIMANFLSQLNNVKYLFSTEELEHSYAVQVMDNIPGIEFLYKNFIENYYINHNTFDDKINLRREWMHFLENNREKLKNEIQSAFETKEDFLIRRNKVLDHLLARFGIDTLKIEVLSEMDARESIQYKLDLLRNYPKLAYEKYSMGPSSLYERETGLTAWIKKNANLKGIGNAKIASIADKISNSASEYNFSFEVYSNKNPVATLLKYGSEIENLVTSGENELSILNDTMELVSKVKLRATLPVDLRQFIHNRIIALDKSSENFLFIDHITLKPSDDLACFGFDVNYAKKPFFVSERTFTLDECKVFSSEFIDFCAQRRNFKIIETSLKEFRIKFDCQYGQLLTRTYFSSFDEANDQLDLFLSSNFDQTVRISYSTKYENHFTNISNPFSYIITILLPSWPSKFQKEGFKKYIEEYFNEVLPSHMVVNLKWLELEEMQAFETQWSHYSESLYSSNKEEKLKSLDTIMTSLVS